MFNFFDRFNYVIRCLFFFRTRVIYPILFSRKEIDLCWLVFRHSLIVAFIVSRHVVIRLF